ncbi:transposase [Pseudoteredinibacter isoporae]|uniref:Insertion element IS402-like domain-containing protein n=1 Tax=Pseudoteredinibacter isoporae TaxID=570281 RepID=A0A7X0MYF6_9GAMM|nr:transposase [Pseudoteredinibacter isoporae]MBB6523024.1 hypothetical protein [Pseudoteredinibacter isoporae]NHO88546.1 transposase [Pseudoteredinibacter isoporae]NIB22763.1 transposase [Pseudoteredinibacter isoporae]
MNKSYSGIDTDNVQRLLSEFEELLPSVKGSNAITASSQLISAVLYITRKQCTWSELPGEFGPARTVYARVDRWAKSGLLQEVFEQLARIHPAQFKIIDVGIAINSPASCEWVYSNIKVSYRNLTVQEDAAGREVFCWYRTTCTQVKVSAE